MALKKHTGRNNGRSKHNTKYGNQNNNRTKSTYKQSLDRYLNLAKEATSHGDQITAEGYYQYAEHYLRQLNEIGGNDHKKSSGSPNQNTSPASDTPESSSQELSSLTPESEAEPDNILEDEMTLETVEIELDPIN